MHVFSDVLQLKGVPTGLQGCPTEVHLGITCISRVYDSPTVGLCT
jgi:hypothetical protein